MQKTVIVIPARKGSSRFPNKPLALVKGKQILRRTWEIACAVRSVDEVYIATDDEEIRSQALQFGAQVILTHGNFLNGTERVYSAIRTLKEQPDIIINLQGDAILTPPWVVQSVVDLMQRDSSIGIATPATQLDWKRYDDFVKSKSNNKTSGTLVVFDKNYNALYFSKAIIPFIRNRTSPTPQAYRHIGLYGYRFEALKHYCELAPSPLEEMEMLEQLRALENGIQIRVALVDYQGRTHWSIDHPDDIHRAEEIITHEGELT